MIYPLVIVPLAVLCCSNATNFLAGFNGLEAGMGVVLHFSLGVFALMSNRLAAAALALVFATVLVSFLRYNWYPGKVFPGDLNYTIGAVAACVAVLGNMEKFAILCFTPWVIEAVLKALSGFKDTLPDARRHENGALHREAGYNHPHRARGRHMLCGVHGYTPHLGAELGEEDPDPGWRWGTH